ncbi:MAG: hypothetical protein JNK53_03855 [Phycisphaerae bacterium]|nr:hypothetical protein [Phycisphaerae bacterium]
MIEIIVVVVILAIAAMAVVPKFLSTAKQEGDVAVDRVGELLRLFAYRQALSSQQVAIWRDGGDGSIQLLVMDTDPDKPDAKPEWRVDRFAARVRLPDGMDVTDVRMNEQRMRTDEWLLSSTPGALRPHIEIRVAGNGVDSTLVLPRGSASVVRVDEGRESPIVRIPIDLQQAGREGEPW